MGSRDLATKPMGPPASGSRLDYPILRIVVFGRFQLPPGPDWRGPHCMEPLRSSGVPLPVRSRSGLILQSLCAPSCLSVCRSRGFSIYGLKVCSRVLLYAGLSRQIDWP